MTPRGREGGAAGDRRAAGRRGGTKRSLRDNAELARCDTAGPWWHVEDGTRLARGGTAGRRQKLCDGLWWHTGAEQMWHLQRQTWQDRAALLGSLGRSLISQQSKSSRGLSRHVARAAQQGRVVQGMHEGRVAQGVRDELHEQQKCCGSGSMGQELRDHEKERNI